MSSYDYLPVISAHDRLRSNGGLKRQNVSWHSLVLLDSTCAQPQPVDASGNFTNGPTVGFSNRLTTLAGFLR